MTDKEKDKIILEIKELKSKLERLHTNLESSKEFLEYYLSNKYKTNKIATIGRIRDQIEHKNRELEELKGKNNIKNQKKKLKTEKNRLLTEVEILDAQLQQTETLNSSNGKDEKVSKLFKGTKNDYQKLLEEIAVKSYRVNSIKKELIKLKSLKQSTVNSDISKLESELSSLNNELKKLESPEKNSTNLYKKQIEYYELEITTKNKELSELEKQLKLFDKEKKNINSNLSKKTKDLSTIGAYIDAVCKVVVVKGKKQTTTPLEKLLSLIKSFIQSFKLQYTLNASNLTNKNKNIKFERFYISIINEVD
jgi:chromosome segregation ATPase